jgi:hypothetical protein
MDKLEKLVDELVEMSGPRVVPGSRAAHINLNWGSEQFGTVREDNPAREAWARHVKSLCGQIFMQGHGAGWDKHVAVVEQREREFAEAHQYAKDTTAELNDRLARGRGNDDG